MEKTMEKENMMGTMSEGRLLFKLALPMIFSVLVSSLYNIVDSIFVGRIGQSALTAISLGAQYTRIVTICSFGLMLQSLVERLLSSTGRTNGSMAVLLTGAITNLILDPILIFGYLGFPRMGMRGAAIATVIGQCAASAVGLILNLKRNKEITLKASAFRPDFGMMKEIMVIAIPTTLTYSIGSVLTFGMNQVLVHLSLAAPAVYVIYNRVRSFAALPVPYHNDTSNSGQMFDVEKAKQFPVENLCGNANFFHSKTILRKMFLRSMP